MNMQFKRSPLIDLLPANGAKTIAPTTPYITPSAGAVQNSITFPFIPYENPHNMPTNNNSIIRARATCQNDICETFLHKVQAKNAQIV